MAVRGFSHLGITVTDLARSTAFYTEVFGFRVLYENVEPAWKRVGLVLDSTVLELFGPHPVGQALEPIDMLYPVPYGRPKIALTVADVDAAHAALTKRGVPLLGPVTETGRSRLLFALDPDGTPIQLQQFRDGQHRLAAVFGH
ncbi:VOC family protein [Yinghuangia sp. ASG 101]|uniref:VOC family protein n=1 Tax=Yinghuangia sp. ASG 101 TaxID=2896848 RepID=UPI001E65181B|nr:VOC family protein [Yinghuangia sp. ASG 101]UGQ11482.1 VOC family protein [Yinghuangia sp. ASG 101]